MVEQFSLFVQWFIDKQHKERWLYLSEKGMDKVYKNSNQLEKHLDERYCYLVEKNAMQLVLGLLDQYKLDEGFYISFHDYDPSRRIKRREWSAIVSVEYIIIYPNDNLAFYFHHEGWIWVCDRKSNPCTK